MPPNATVDRGRAEHRRMHAKFASRPPVEPFVRRPSRRQALHFRESLLKIRLYTNKPAPRTAPSIAPQVNPISISLGQYGNSESLCLNVCISYHAYEAIKSIRLVTTNTREILLIRACESLLLFSGSNIKPAAVWCMNVLDTRRGEKFHRK